MSALAARVSAERPGLAPSGAIAAFIIISFTTNALMLVGPLFMLQVYDRVIPSRSLPTLVALLILVVTLYGCQALFEIVRTRMVARFAVLFDMWLSPRVYAFRLHRRSDRPAISDPLRDLDTVRQFLGSGAPNALADLPWAPVYLGALFLLHPLFGWVTFGGALITVALLWANELASRRPAREVSSGAALRQLQAEEARLGADTIQAMGLLPAMLNRWREVGSAYNQAQRRAADRASLSSAAMKTFRYSLQSIILATGAFLVLEGQLSGGLMIAASILSSRALAPADQLVGQWRSLIAARLAWQRLSALLKASSASAPKTALPTPFRTMTVHRLSVGPNQQTPLVNAITFDLKAGEAMAIIGPSGSGKSCLGRGLVGAWPTLQGEIRLDGSELQHFDGAAIGPSIGYLGQQVELFFRTIADNICRFERPRNDEALFAAANAAGIHDLVAGMPAGYDSEIGERGQALSAGQRQRIGLARALYRDPFLLVLDEPNSNLDGDGDAALAEAILKAKARGAIVIVIAHRPSAMVHADKVLMLRRGVQQAFGSKDEVLPAVVQRLGTARPAAVAATHG